MDNIEVEIMLTLLIKCYFFMRYSDCIIILKELCKKLKNKKGLNELNQINPIIEHVGNNPNILLSKKYFIAVSENGITREKRSDLAKYLIDAKERIIKVLLMLLEEYPLNAPAVINQLNSITGGNTCQEN